MEKTVKNEHLSNWKLICTESKNCCKSVLFRPKFGLESHGLRYIWYPPNKNLPLCMFYWYLHLWFDYVKKNKKTKKPRENQNKTKKQYSRTLAKAKIQKTSRKPKKNKKTKKNNIPGLLQKQKSKKPRENQKKQKNQKKQYSRTLAKVKMQKSKKPRENQKNQKKQYSRSLEIGSTGKSPGTLFFLFFLVFLVFSRFFGFLHFYFCKSPGILVFLIFLVFLVFSRFFGFLLLQESWNIVFFSFFVFFGFLEVFWKFGEVKEKMFFGNFAKLKKHLSFAKIQKSQDYAYILEYFGNFRKTPLFAIYPFLLYWIAHIIICLSFVFMY